MGRNTSCPWIWAVPPFRAPCHRLAFRASIAGGVRIPITDHFGVRLDVRAFLTVLDSESDLFCVSSSGLTCTIRAKSDTFLQYSANLGVTVGF